MGQTIDIEIDIRKSIFDQKEKTILDCKIEAQGYIDVTFLFYPYPLS